MKMLLSLVLAVVMSIMPVLVAIPVGVGASPAEAAPNGGGLTVPLPNGATFSITRFAESEGRLFAVGTITGTNPAGQPVIAPFAWEVLHGPDAQAARAAGQQVIAQQATCDILNLVLAPLHLDLLGLVIDLPNPLVINIFAQQGPGNLLGNLLCAITGLLDGTGPLGQLVAALNRLIDALNNL